MKRWNALFLAAAAGLFLVAGCAKKSTEEASINGTGFESISTEELAQLPQATANQQAGVEVLPIEVSPITQGVPPIAGPTPTEAGTSASPTTVTSLTQVTSGLTREQMIQTALKNAGFYQGEVDGKIGPVSRRAIREFQSRNSLKVDGKVGPQTWAALEPYLNGTAATGTD